MLACQPVAGICLNSGGRSRMSQRFQRFIFPIIVMIAIAIYIVIPSSPGIHIHALGINIDRTFDTHLGLDLVGGVQALLEANLPASTPITSADMNTARQIVENRVNGLGVSEAVVQIAGERRILVELPGETDPEKALATIQQTGLLEFVDLSSLSNQEAFALTGTTIRTDFGQANQGNQTTPTSTQAITPTTTISSTQSITTTPTISETTPITGTQAVTSTNTVTNTNVVTGTNTITGTQATPTGPVFHTIMTGAALSNVGVQVNPTSGQYEVSFELKSDGAKIFGDYTTAHVGQVLAIVLDKKVISAPTINSPITDGKGVIQGNFTAQTANDLAVQLRYGSLPIPLKVVTSKTVGPTLGQDSLRKSLQAGVIGLIVVILFMGLYYRLPGTLADLALLVYAVTTFAVFKLVPVTLTLPGIAGFVLSVGMAVDANVLIFERLKEELRAGRTLRQAIDLGWARAWPSIRDSNLSTLITCLILFWFGSAFGANIVKGFALTLSIGVGISMFTAIIVTRTFLHLVLDNVQFAEHHSWFGV
jgi:preprotein translocase subunit SecD